MYWHHQGSKININLMKGILHPACSLLQHRACRGHFSFKLPPAVERNGLAWGGCVPPAPCWPTRGTGDPQMGDVPGTWKGVSEATEEVWRSYPISYPAKRSPFWKKTFSKVSQVSYDQQQSVDLHQLLVTLRQCEESILVGKFKSCTEIRTMRSHQRVCISYHHSLNILVKDPKSESDLLARKLLQGCRQTLRRRMKGRPYNRAKGNAWFRLLSWRFAATPNVGWSLSLALCSALLQGSSTSIMRKLSTSPVESIGLQPYYCGSQIVHLQVFWLLCCFFGVGHDLQLKVFLLVLQLRAFPSI